MTGVRIPISLSAGWFVLIPTRDSFPSRMKDSFETAGSFLFSRATQSILTTVSCVCDSYFFLFISVTGICSCGLLFLHVIVGLKIIVSECVCV